MPSDDVLKMDAGHVTIEEKKVGLCEECGDAASSHVVWLEIAPIGQKNRIGEYCGDCARGIAEDLRKSLPTEAS